MIYWKGIDTAKSNDYKEVFAPNCDGPLPVSEE
jgi:hypothetical protein